MQSLNMYFMGRNQVELISESVAMPDADQVLVQTTKTLISTGTETICLERRFEPDSHYDRWVQYPFSPGYSLAGRVVEVGSGVADFKPGDRVAIRAGHRQYVLTSPDRLQPIPDSVTDEDATWFGLGNIAQNGIRQADHALGDTVVIVGLGLLGQLVVQYTRLMGARQIIVIDPARARLDMACAHGATSALAMGVAEARAEVMSLTDGKGADVIYEITGAPAVFQQTLPLLRRFGKLLLLGDTGLPSEQCLTPDIVLKGLKVIGAHDSNPPAESSDHAHWSHREMTDLFFRYVQRGDMRVSDLITHRYAPTEAAKAYELLRIERESAMGVIFDWTQQ
jgi:2-desacetyl-2-hydroxyethyl bacteriochlorophyllide A dehydrogenase